MQRPRIADVGENGARIQHAAALQQPLHERRQKIEAAVGLAHLLQVVGGFEVVLPGGRRPRQLLQVVAGAAVTLLA